ncbi:hypothetical protein EW146_g9878 [Bondarzewia mesenterica]|uniref:tRNA (uracil-O(2)-)-methyltransferase n=1 Tax=Bondarzewia mesenterica TaxID=1095465 RepID=A0A4S4L3V0_9AGAM|nr:hypothetical protein EW146_g9878 [Bondarzewia mesenterica]
MSQRMKPRFVPSSCRTYSSSDPPLGTNWVPILTCAADFPIELFGVAITQLIDHPEYNSTLILRSETLQDSTDEFPDLAPELEGLIPIRNIHRLLLPRRPMRDSSLEQHCTLYSTSSTAPPSLLVLTPIVSPHSSLPYYHPTVFHLAFRYLSSSPASLRIEVVPLPGTLLDPDSRLYRTSLALLETLHRYGWGTLTQYRKRVAHDQLVKREEYQDLYLVMRERYKHLVGQWKEVTDPLKHVFEDVGIATFLMLLWKNTYRSPTSASDKEKEDPCDEPWKHWPRPPGGFVDLGCGNGLLTHILVSEGYAGTGFDLRARTSWAHYPPNTQQHLRVHAFNPTTSLPSLSPSEHQSASPDHSTSSGRATNESDGYTIPPQAFLIGNHADELTPWVPVVATLCDASGYLSIPCCAWTFDRKFDRARDRPWPVPPAPQPSAPCADSSVASSSTPHDLLNSGPEQLSAFIATLTLGADNNLTSSYAQYRIWLATLSSWLGWAVECEMLRIPSTRNWAVVGRNRLGVSNEVEAPSDDEERNVNMNIYVQRVRDVVEGVQLRGTFKTRRPEGKAGDTHEKQHHEQNMLGDRKVWLDEDLNAIETVPEPSSPPM